MKIWFEITNSPHINLFNNIINKLKKEHEVIITCRPLANTVELLELYNYKYNILGRHYGKNIFLKIIGFPVRVFQLVKFFWRDKPDIAIGQSSFQMPLAAKILGVPCIYMNDNEHAKGNILSFLFSNKILIPEFLSKALVVKQFGNINKIIQYPGIKEGIYLWRVPQKIKSGDSNTKTIFYRSEPRTAQYYKGDTTKIDSLLIKLKTKYNIIISPRDKFQRMYYDQDKFNGINILKEPMTFHQIVIECDMFIGAGGTMTREMAVSGVPTISIYQDKLLSVDEYLISKGLLVHKKNINEEFIDNYFDSYNKKSNKDILVKGEKAEKLIINLLLDLSNRT